MTDLNKLYVLLRGYEILRKSASTRGEGEGFVLALPISAYLLDTAPGFVLIDTGFDAASSVDAEEPEGSLTSTRPCPRPWSCLSTTSWRSFATPGSLRKRCARLC